MRAARQEEIKFLNTVLVFKKVPEADAKGKERVSVRWCDVNKGDSSNVPVRSQLVGRESRWKDPLAQGTFAATPPVERPGTSVIEFRPVDDVMGGNWTSSCLCWTYPERISTHQLCVNCTSLCQRKTHHLAWLDSFFERSMRRETRLMNGTSSRTRKLLQSGTEWDIAVHAFTCTTRNHR